jgi:hypothetical protein
MEKVASLWRHLGIGAYESTLATLRGIERDLKVRTRHG